MAELDRKLERALDYAIYEKYRRLSEWQALKTTYANSEKRLKRLEEEDKAALSLMGFIYEKNIQLKNT